MPSRSLMRDPGTLTDAPKCNTPRPGWHGGRYTSMCEWRLIAAAHNLLKLHKHQIAAAA